MDPIAYYDQLPPVEPEALRGVWKGASFPTGHPMDNALEAFGWYGKAFQDAERVHPLLFQSANGQIFAVDPARIPLTWITGFTSGQLHFLSRFSFLLKWFFRTRKYKARLRQIEFRGKLSAAMIYDDLPIQDIFRKIDDDTLLGWMDMKGQEQPFFFLLKR